MLKEKLGDDDDADIWQEAWGNFIKSAILASVAVACFLLYEVLDDYGGLGAFFTALGLSPSRWIPIGHFLLFWLWIIPFGVMAWRLSDLNAIARCAMARHIEFFWGRNLFANILLVICAGLRMYATFGRLAPGQTPDFGRVCFTAFYVFVLAIAAAIGPLYFDSDLRALFDDELIRDMRAKATRAGYLTVMVLGSFAVVLNSVYRGQEIFVFCGVLFAGMAMAHLYYVYLYWRAGRGS